MSKVASVEIIDKIYPHPNATALELCQVLGWTVCVKKGIFKEGDKCCFIAVDSQVEEKTVFEFLRSKNFRIKTCKLRGICSQGICFTLQELGINDNTLAGTEVSELVGAKHWEKPIPLGMAGLIEGNIPSFLIKTDEENLKNYPRLIDELMGKDVMITMKIDGSSTSCYLKDGKFGVCSRRLEIKKNEDNVFWRIAIKHDIEGALRREFDKSGRELCVQGEATGPKLNGNNLGLKDWQIFAFNLFDINKFNYINGPEAHDYFNVNVIPAVPVAWQGTFNFTLEQLVKMANDLTYPNGSCAEGIVIRPTVEQRSEILRGRLSAKIISEKYSLKND